MAAVVYPGFRQLRQQAVLSGIPFRISHSLLPDCLNLLFYNRLLRWAIYQAIVGS
ncbi:MAG TPA: hypothetical protein VII93_02175 [Anaerolineales bacterium]